MKTTEQNPQNFIVPLNMNGLNGRMMRLPAPARHKREILFIYGHHSSLERWWGLMQAMNSYGAVTMPDLPGFGGMDSYYKIGQKPTIDALADYLAAFVKLQYKRKKVTIVGMSFGFVIATRMLQRNPELVRKVDLLISLAGFAHKDDFTFSFLRRNAYLWGSRIMSMRIPAFIFRYGALNSFVLSNFYHRTHNAKNKFKGLNDEQRKQMTQVEIALWQNNDVRTYMKTTVEFLTFDNCKVKIDLPVGHVAVKADHFFDNHIVEQHMRVIFNDFQLLATLDMASHAPSIIASAKEAAPFIPPKLRRMLRKA